MASGMNMGLVLVLAVIMTLLCGRTMAQSDCTNVLIGMAPCLSYVSGSASTPSASCCSQLASVVRSQPRCLCMVLNGGGASLGVSINETLALKLPSACNVQTPPVSRCNDSDGPPLSPFGSPVGSPEALPGDSSAGTGSKTVPSAGGSEMSNSKTIKVPIQLLVISFLFMASYPLTAASF
ncbi:Non-specific lipid-transfer protein-like protein [Melia azedarach]|uniref:Non-specific lipid-transfer protein-like protein n=1 Tax=Melia azedarach TaxID=155640 RepID=A0ACC1YFQ0_MELAZ|nr:Non-specific lipid-transfer protein-like protein [Melia azedarach]